MNAAVRLVEVRVPDMGNFKDVAVIDVLVKPGESIEPEAPLVTLETEKATMDVPSTASGVIEKIHVAKGGKVNAGDLIATVRPAGDGAQAAAPAPAREAAPPANPARPAPRSGAKAAKARARAPRQPRRRPPLRRRRRRGSRPTRQPRHRPRRRAPVRPPRSFPRLCVPICLRSTSPASPGRMRDRACAGLRASWAST